MGEVRPLTDAERVVESSLEGKRRSENCLIDIHKACERWNCKINPIIVISGKGIIAHFEAVPMDFIPKDITGKGNNGKGS